MCLTVHNPSDPCCASAPPSPLFGYVTREMIPQVIDDYEGLSDAAWSYGVTGNESEAISMNCLYHHFTTPNARTVSVLNVMQPVRWRLAAPEVDGGQYDYWMRPDENFAHLHHHGSFQLGSYGIRHKLMPRNWHCRFRDHIAEVLPPLPVKFCKQRPIPNGKYLELALQAIAPDLQPWISDGSDNDYPVSVSLVAIQYWVDGQKAKPLVLIRPGLPEGAFRFPLRPDRTVEIDVWYRIGVEAAELYEDVPAKGCGYIPLTNVANGSRRLASNSMNFFNVDFSTGFNYQKHTYEITLSGHSGWTLKDGSNGPHLMTRAHDDETDLFYGSMVVEGANLNGAPNPFVTGIALDFSREIADIGVDPGPAMTGVSGHFIYRPDSDLSHYRQSTTSADYGTVQHAPAGRFDQAGTTVFRLVPWTVIGDTGIDIANAEGFTGTPDPIPRFVPRAITLRRVNL